MDLKDETLKNIFFKIKLRLLCIIRQFTYMLVIFIISVPWKFRDIGLTENLLKIFLFRIISIDISFREQDHLAQQMSQTFSHGVKHFKE